MATSSSSSIGSSSSGHATGFKVYGSVFKVSSRYQFLNPLGKGSYGIVCAAKDRETGQCVAIKKVSPMTKRTVDAKHTLREVLLLQLLGKHPNVISVHNLSTNLKDDELYIVMDLMDTDMHRVIQSSQHLSDAHAKYFLHQLLRGVKYLHDNGVLHRDLKPGNLLLSKTCQLKIADFGLARKIPRVLGSSGSTLERPRSAPAASSGSSSNRIIERPPMTEHVVTRWYRAPELMLQPDGLYDQSVDMWSVGCIFAEILGRKALFPGKNFLHQLTLIFDVIGAPPPEATTRIQSSQAQRFLRSLGQKPKVPFRTLFPNACDAAVDLLDRLLEFDPAKRISAQVALDHPYMQDIERKHRHRSGGVDAPPSMRADFSFDLKNLSKLDLRALIVKEVDNHRKSVTLRDSSVHGDASALGDSSDTPDLHRPAVEKPRSGLTPHAISSSTPTANIGSAGARLSKLHTNLRHAQAQSHQLDAAQQRHPQAVTFGSNRQRIRAVSKPPVPKQQEAGVSVSNQHEHVRVVAAQASLLSDSLTSRVSPPPEEEESKPPAPARDLNPPLLNSVPMESSTKVEPVNSPTTSLEQLKSRTRTSFSYQNTQGHYAIVRKPESTPAAESTNADAIATAIALSQRSKALIASLSVSAKPPDPVVITSRGGTSTAWQTNKSRNPESSSSSSSASSPASPPRSDASDSQKCCGVSRSNRPGSAMLLTTSKRPKPVNPTAAKLTGRPRRVSSAGSVRSKSRPLTATGSLTARATNTYVGSVNSLMRAQRSNAGQSLAESANSMLATISRNEHQEESSESREEASQLKPQRSSSQLHCSDAVGKRHPAKKLTVPRSPKFSVMSWQKKREASSRVGSYATGIPH
ncbi:hypothetical protein PF005_g23057 [Phytophthora fragariae]|uniref:Protein kinase domain-containing protein n=1 Tax=Phytophthora fragariae TaxID=53985 RepID=A0A6A3X5P1_9STRA|nr:hypothetical protein PF003_g22181 [Phytophthora fragariae]KAE8939480.1 hypothetical protein PF009_g10671 [Phytophthora fragariae]KAE8967487.1 hypothetical protein PF011_g27540 [Phytophthora fragariae]KAE9065651.1 hypothetical protein PF010_g28112 [Phytophthora fragariae]KAE9080293.1 hypothetical protein PF007_g23106 [Phytophthora fragariae]